MSEHPHRVHEFAAPGAPAAHAFAADQGEAWAETGRREVRAGRRSGIAALREFWAAEEHDARPLAAAFPWPDGATGLAVAVVGRLVALELFDHPQTLGASWPFLVETRDVGSSRPRRAVVAGSDSG